MLIFATLCPLKTETEKLTFLLGMTKLAVTMFSFVTGSLISTSSLLISFNAFPSERVMVISTLWPSSYFLSSWSREILAPSTSEKETVYFSAIETDSLGFSVGSSSLGFVSDGVSEGRTLGSLPLLLQPTSPKASKDKLSSPYFFNLFIQ